MEKYFYSIKNWNKLLNLQKKRILAVSPITEGKHSNFSWTIYLYISLLLSKILRRSPLSFLCHSIVTSVHINPACFLSSSHHLFWGLLMPTYIFRVFNASGPPVCGCFLRISTWEYLLCRWQVSRLFNLLSSRYLWINLLENGVFLLFLVLLPPSLRFPCAGRTNWLNSRICRYWVLFFVFNNSIDQNLPINHTRDFILVAFFFVKLHDLSWIFVFFCLSLYYFQFRTLVMN